MPFGRLPRKHFTWWKTKIDNQQSLEAKVKPVGTKDNGAGKDGSDNKKDNAAASPKAAPTKTEILLEPVIHCTQQKELHKTRQTAWTIIIKVGVDYLKV